MNRYHDEAWKSAAGDQGGSSGGKATHGKGRPGSQKRLSSISGVVAAVQADVDSHDWVDYALISATEGREIKQRIGGHFDPTGYTRCVVATEVHKILRDHAGDARSITPDDISQVPQWLWNPISQEFVTRKGKPPVLKTSVRDAAGTVIVEEIRTDRKKLALLSIYRP